MLKRVALSLLAFVPAARAAERSYTVDAGSSQVRVHVGKAGIASFAGHEHEVRAPIKWGTVVADPDDPTRSRVELGFETAALTVSAEGEPAGDAPKVQEAMVGPKVLDAAHFPAVSFRSTRVVLRQSTTSAYELEVAGELSLHGVTRALVVPVRVETAEGRLVANGRMRLGQRDYGIHAVGVGNLVKVKDELEIEFHIEAHSSP